MINFFENNIEILIVNSIITFILIFLQNKLSRLGKLHLNIFKMKVNIINHNSNWSDKDNSIGNKTKYIELNFILQLYNNQNNNNSIYNLDVVKKNKIKKVLTEYHNLNLTDVSKAVLGSTTYEKIKYINILPYEVKEYRLNIKLTKDEYSNLKKQPIYICYKNKNKTKLLKLSKYLKNINDTKENNKIKVD